MVTIYQNSSTNLNTPRVCIVTQRGFRNLVARCPDYEFEDIICEVDDVDLISPRPYPWFRNGIRYVHRLSRHVVAPLASLNPGLRTLHLKRNYELFMAVCLETRDLLYLNAIKGWRERCKIAVCWLDEIWAGELHKFKGILKILSKFDYIFIGCLGSVSAVKKAIQKPCAYMPAGIDAFRFSPYPDPPVRSIDVYNMGRRSEVTHQALLEMARKKRIFYLYDTIHSGNMYALDYRQHRDMISNIMKRSRYLLTNIAKFDREFETHGQDEIGFRFFEGAAAGTVLIGNPPKNSAFEELFDWTDSIISAPFDVPEISEIISELDSQPERLEEIKINNVVNSILRHDWSYRWEEILEVVDMKPKEEIEERKNRLKKLADEARDFHESSFYNIINAK